MSRQALDRIAARATELEADGFEGAAGLIRHILDDIERTDGERRLFISMSQLAGLFESYQPAGYEPSKP